MKKFWNWKTRSVMKDPPDENSILREERTLYLNGAIADGESWFDDEVTPQAFKKELNSGEGDITVWINSPGGDCVAAAQIYNMLREYAGDVTVKIDGLAASAASVIAMAGDEVLMSPVSTMMIHNPSTIAAGDSAEMKKAAQMLGEVKESIINAYEIKTGLSRRELGKLMDSEYWMNANEALEKGFIDGVLYKEEDEESETAPAASMGYSPAQVTNSIMEKIAAKCKIEKSEAKSKTEKPEVKSNTEKPEVKSKTNKPAEPKGRSYDDLMERLNLIKNHM